MSGDPKNASLWTDADVYVDPTRAATQPMTADDDMPVGWSLVGLLDGGDGFTNTQEWGQDNDFFAWGGLLVRNHKGQFKYTKKFTALEDNPTTRSLLWPGSTAGTISVPKIAKIGLAFEVREGDVTHRAFTKNYATVTVDGDWKEGEDDLTKYSLSAVIFPDSDKVLFTTQDSDESSSSSI